jgi:peptide/nickel transport system permease protein
MFIFVLKRLVYTTILLAIVSLTIFFIFDLIPVDPARLVCSKQCTPSLVEANRQRLGLDVSVLEQWWRFIVGLFAGRTFGEEGIAITCAAPALGYSFSRHECVTTIVAEAFPFTLSLALGAFVLWLSVGISLGVLSAILILQFS